MKLITSFSKLMCIHVEVQPSSNPCVSEVVEEIKETGIHVNENNAPLENLECIVTKYGDFQDGLVHLGINLSGPKHIEWVDIKSIIPRVGR